MSRAERTPQRRRETRASQRNPQRRAAGLSNAFDRKSFGPANKARNANGEISSIGASARSRRPPALLHSTCAPTRRARAIPRTVARSDKTVAILKDGAIVQHPSRIVAASVVACIACVLRDNGATASNTVTPSPSAQCERHRMSSNFEATSKSCRASSRRIKHGAQRHRCHHRERPVIVGFNL